METLTESGNTYFAADAIGLNTSHHLYFLHHLHYDWRFVAKFNNIFLYSTLCILYAISTMNIHMQAHIIGIFNNKHIYDLFIQLQLCLFLCNRHLLIQESKLIFVSLQELDKFVQASVNIHSTNVKTC